MLPRRTRSHRVAGKRNGHAPEPPGAPGGGTGPLRGQRLCARGPRAPVPARLRGRCRPGQPHPSPPARAASPAHSTPSGAQRSCPAGPWDANGAVGGPRGEPRMAGTEASGGGRPSPASGTLPLPHPGPRRAPGTLTAPSAPAAPSQGTSGAHRVRRTPSFLREKHKFRGTARLGVWN